jgi:hypothetical protein
MVSAPADHRPDMRARLYAAPERATFLTLTGVACVALVIAGYRSRAELDLSPRSGLGYGLGVVGLAAMGLLLLYSLRKRVRLLKDLGPIHRWFHAHMLLGILGPTAIIFHTAFHVGSTNSVVALVAMLVVAASGFVGRFFYTRVHYGLFGRRETLRELTERADASRSALQERLEASSGAAACVQDFEREALARPTGPFAATARFLTLGWRVRFARRRVLRLLRASNSGRDDSGSDDLAREVRTHLALVQRVAEFTAYERILSLWHGMHLPLCVILFLAAALHVIAVHVY